MGTRTASDYKAQLPKPVRISFRATLDLLYGLATIASLVIAINLPKEYLATVLVYYLVVVNFILFAYVVWREMAKIHRYPQAVFFTHYVNHVIRDYLATFDGREPVAKDLITDILNATAESFSILTGVKCRTSIKELREDLTIHTFARNSTSGTSVLAGTDNTQHRLDENTDFHDLWYSEEGCSRFFLSNSLIRDFRAQSYNNSSFKRLGKPIVRGLGALSWVSDWRLPYRSTLVLPIRFIADFTPPRSGTKSKSTASENWSFWGFLCIDASRRYVFDSRYMPELGATFADALYTVFNQINVLSQVNIQIVNHSVRSKKRNVKKSASRAKEH